MNQINQLVEVLQLQLRMHGMTYAQLAKKLHISEASVKRMFSKKEMTLSRLESICSHLHLHLSDLFELLAEHQTRIKNLTAEQEKSLVADPVLLIVAVSVMNHWQFNDILGHYDISQFELINKLALLDKIKLVDFMPGNRIKSLLHPDFDWLSNGPIQQYFNDTIKGDFFASHFKLENETLIMRTGMLSARQLQKLQSLLKSTAKTFISACHEERKLSVDEKQGAALVMALRPWVPLSFRERQRSLPKPRVI